jgi:hypothetical protein
MSPICLLPPPPPSPPSPSPALPLRHACHPHLPPCCQPLKLLRGGTLTLCPVPVARCEGHRGSVHGHRRCLGGGSPLPSSSSHCGTPPACSRLSPAGPPPLQAVVLVLTDLAPSWSLPSIVGSSSSSWPGLSTPSPAHSSRQHRPSIKPSPRHCEFGPATRYAALVDEPEPIEAFTPELQLAITFKVLHHLEMAEKSRLLSTEELDLVQFLVASLSSSLACKAAITGASSGSS